MRVCFNARTRDLILGVDWFFLRILGYIDLTGILYTVFNACLCGAHDLWKTK